MKIIYIIGGLVSLFLGIIGIILPILPTTPFLLLTLYFFAKGSERFHHWFVKTKLFKNYLETFVLEKTMSKKRKWQLLLFTDLIIVTTILLMSNIYVTLTLLTLNGIKYMYFFTQVKTI